MHDAAGRVALCATHRSDWKPVAVDWSDATVQRRIAGGRRQLLARAVGLHRREGLRVLDATAGLGRDGYTLAALGAHVTLIERQALVAALLRDAHARASNADDPAMRAAAERIDVVEAEAGAFLRDAPLHRFDAIYLDPMYEDAGRRALPQKEMQLLRDLSGGDDDAAALLPIARARAPRVAVKRAPKAEWLAGMRPDAVIEGTQARFDVYLGMSPGAPSPAGNPTCFD